MSTKKRQTKVLKSVPQKDKRTQQAGSLSSPNISLIEKASFLKECQADGEAGGWLAGNPLHSTAMEEDMPPAEGQRQEAGGACPKGSNSDTPKRPTKAQTQVAVRDGQPAPSGVSVSGKMLRRSLGAKHKARPVKESLQEAGKGAGEDPARASPSVPQSPAAFTDTPNSPSPTKKRRRSSLSSEELSGDDLSWNPSPMAKTSKFSDDRLSNGKSSGDRSSNRKSSGDRSSNRKSSGARRSLQGQRRKSSSGSSGSAGAAGRPNQQHQRRVKKKNPGDLDVVLDSFLEFTSLYREAVESKAVRQAIDDLSNSMQDQLSAKITEAQELNHLRTESRKVAATINRKRERLLEAKNEAIRNASEVREQQRERATLQQRLEDLRRGSALLSGLKQLHSSNLQDGNSNQPYKYGPSSLPALLLEVQGVLGTEKQLRMVNDRLETAMDMPT